MRTAKTNEDTHYRYGYQGEFSEEDEETGWNSFELRMYDPVVARWISPDPARQYASPYVSMGNNPINLVDPDGAFAEGGGDDPEPLQINWGDAFGRWSASNKLFSRNLDFQMNIEEGTQVMMPLEGTLDFALDFMSPREYTSVFGVQYNVGSDGRLGNPIPTTGTAPIGGLRSTAQVAYRATDFFVKLSNGAYRARSGFTGITTSAGKVLSNSRIISSSQLTGKYYYATRTTPVIGNFTKTWIIYEQKTVLSNTQRIKMMGAKLLELLSNF